MNYIDDYVIFLKTEKKLGDASIESYKLDLKSFNDYIKKDLKNITTEEILQYLNLLRKDLKPKSVNRHISALKGFYNYLVDENIVENNGSTLEHEATISKINEEKLNYLMGLGISEDAAKDLYVLGFMSDFKKSLPMEYAVELNRLIKE